MIDYIIAEESGRVESSRMVSSLSWVTSQDTAWGVFRIRAPEV
jgi:hypothetical protein